MRRLLITLSMLIGLVSPALVHAQAGDASPLQQMEGLESAIGRSWMPGLVTTELSTETEYNDQGTPVWEISSRSEPASTPVVLPEHQTLMLSVFVYQFDSEANAAAGLDALNNMQLEQHRRDPRSPAINEFDPGVGDASHGWQGEFEVERIGDKDATRLSVVYLMVQDGDLVYQLFGQFLPGNEIEIATGVMKDMIATEVGTADPVFAEDGSSTGGLWEKLNAVNVSFPEQGLNVFDLQIWPMDENAVRAGSVQVPVIDLEHLGEVPGLVEGWYARYGQAPAATATPTGEAPEGLYHVDVWVLEFDSSDAAIAAAISIQAPIIEPLGIIASGSGVEYAEDQAPTMTMEGTGFVKDRSLPEGDASYAIVVDENTVYVTRVYANGPATDAIAQDVIQYLRGVPASVATPVGQTMTDDGSGRLPASESDVVHGLTVLEQRHITPASPMATPD